MSQSQNLRGHVGQNFVARSVGILVFLFTALAPVQAFAQGAVCNSHLNWWLTGPQGNNWFVGDELTVNATVAAGDIGSSGSTEYLQIPSFGFAGDCTTLNGLTWGNCTEANSVAIEYLGDPTSDNCKDASGEDISFRLPESNTITFFPINPIHLVENSSCKVAWKFKVSKFNTDATKVKLNQVSAFAAGADPATCVVPDAREPDGWRPIGTTSSGNNGYVNIDTCGITVEKQICAPDKSDCTVNGNWSDADTEGNALLLSSDGLAAYRAIITNTGSVPYTGDIKVDDNLLGIHTTTGSLDPGESVTVGGAGAVSSWKNACTSNINISNTLAVEASCRGGNVPVSASASNMAWGNCEDFRIAQPGITVEKATNGQDADTAPGPQIAVGAAVNWTYFVTNTGNVPLTSVGVVDDQGVSVTCPQSTLAAGASMTCTGAGTAEAGQYANVGKATGTPPTGDPVMATDPSHYFGVRASISVEKSTNGQDADTATGPQIAVGGAVNWTYFVTNTSNVTLTSVSVTDDQGVSVTCPQSTLAAGASMTCTGAGTAEAGQYANVGKATGTPPVGDPVMATDPSHYFGTTSNITIEKSTNGQDADSAPGPQIAVGGAVNWTYFVTNTSNVTLTSVGVTDDQGVVVTCPKSTLIAGESMTCTGAGTAEAGQYANVGKATGTPPVGDPVMAADPSHYFGVRASVTIEKSTNGEDADTAPGPQIAVGGAVNWTYFVTNTSNVTLTSVGVTDDQGVVVTCPKSTLTAGESMTCTGAGTAEAGQYANVGKATGTPPVGDPVMATDPSHYFGTGAPSILILKEISVDDGATWKDADDVGSAAIAVYPSDALYRFTVTNNGDAPLKNVVINDSELGITGDDEYVIGDMAVGEVVIITVADEPLLSFEDRCTGRGTFTNTATASGLSAQTDAPVNDDDKAVLKCIGEPHITILKEISPTGGEPWFDDDTTPQEYPSDAWYRISVTNDGTAPLTDVRVLDGDLLVDKIIGALAVNQTVVLTSAEVSELYQKDRCTGGGRVGNLASVSGKSADDPDDTVDDSDTANLVCVGLPMIDVIKEISVNNQDWFDANTEGDAVMAQAPSNAWYRITVKNTSQVDMTDVILNDGTLGIINYAVGDIAALQQVVLTSGEISSLSYPNRCTGTGTFGNTATAKGKSVETGSESSDSDEAWLECTGTPDIQIVKEISTNNGLTWYDDSTPSILPPVDAWYRLTVTNTGTADLDGVVVNDAELGIVNYAIGYLAVNQTVVLTEDQIDELFKQNRCTAAGSFVNTASASGTSLEYPYGSVNDSDTATLACGERFDICEDGGGRPRILKLQYNGTYGSDNAQGVVGNPNSAGPIPVNPVTIKLYDKNTLKATLSPVNVGDPLNILGSWTQSGKIPPNIKVEILNESGSQLLQSISFHGSCSAPLIIGDSFGGVTIIGYTH